MSFKICLVLREQLYVEIRFVEEIQMLYNISILGVICVVILILLFYLNEN